MIFFELYERFICLVRKFVVYLHCQKQTMYYMDKIRLTEKEKELIRAIRNYRASYPNGYPELLYFIQQLVDELTDID